MNEVTRLLVAARERMNWLRVGRPRLPKRATGQRRSWAIVSSLVLGLSARGLPTRSSSNRSSWLSE